MTVSTTPEHHHAAGKQRTLASPCMPGSNLRGKQADDQRFNRQTKKDGVSKRIRTSGALRREAARTGLLGIGECDREFLPLAVSQVRCCVKQEQKHRRDLN